MIKKINSHAKQNYFKQESEFYQTDKILIQNSCKGVRICFRIIWFLMTLMNAVIGLNLMKSQPQVLTQRKTLSNGWRKIFLISRELSLSLTRKKRSKQQRLKYQNSSNPNIDIKLQKSEDGCRNSSNLGGNSSYLNFLKTPVI